MFVHNLLYRRLRFVLCSQSTWSRCCARARWAACVRWSCAVMCHSYDVCLCVYPVSAHEIGASQSTAYVRELGGALRHRFNFFFSVFLQCAVMRGLLQQVVVMFPTHLHCCFVKNSTRWFVYVQSSLDCWRKRRNRHTSFLCEVNGVIPLGYFCNWVLFLCETQLWLCVCASVLF